MTVAVNHAVPLSRERHRNRRKFARVRHNKQELAFAQVQANRLSTTVAIVYARMLKYSADQIRAAANLAAIP